MMIDGLTIYLSIDSGFFILFITTINIKLIIIIIIVIKIKANEKKIKVRWYMIGVDCSIIIINKISRLMWWLWEETIIILNEKKRNLPQNHFCSQFFLCLFCPSHLVSHIYVAFVLLMFSLLLFLLLFVAVNWIITNHSSLCCFFFWMIIVSILMIWCQAHKYFSFLISLYKNA